MEYQEARKGRNSRRVRAMEKGSKFGRDQQEEAWQNAEVDVLFRLANAGVSMPKPYGCFDCVLLMELIPHDEGHVAPRLNDISMTSKLMIQQFYLNIKMYNTAKQSEI